MSNFKFLPNNEEETDKLKKTDGDVSEYHQWMLRTATEIAYQLKRIADKLEEK